jgi:hypothetical protein
VGLNESAPVTDTIRVSKHVPPQFFGRETELAELDAALTDPSIRVHSLIAFGGVGKTSLVARWLQKVAADGWRGGGIWNSCPTRTGPRCCTAWA